MMTGFGGKTLSGPHDSMAGGIGGVYYPFESIEPAPLGLLVEGEFGYIFGKDSLPYVSLNAGGGFAGFRFEKAPYLLMPYIIVGAGNIESESTINAGGGIFTGGSWGVRLDYRHFFLHDDSSEFDRVILGLQHFFTPQM
jgi:hypothetical protein